MKFVITRQELVASRLDILSILKEMGAPIAGHTFLLVQKGYEITQTINPVTFDFEFCFKKIGT